MGCAFRGAFPRRSPRVLMGARIFHLGVYFYAWGHAAAQLVWAEMPVCMLKLKFRSGSGRLMSVADTCQNAGILPYIRTKNSQFFEFPQLQTHESKARFTAHRMEKTAMKTVQYSQSYSTKCHRRPERFRLLFPTTFSDIFGLPVNADQKCAFVRLQLRHLRLTAHLFPVVACPDMQNSLRGDTKCRQKQEISQKLFRFAKSTSQKSRVIRFDRVVELRKLLLRVQKDLVRL